MSTTAHLRCRSSGGVHAEKGLEDDGEEQA